MATKISGELDLSQVPKYEFDAQFELRVAVVLVERAALPRAEGQPYAVHFQEEKED